METNNKNYKESLYNTIFQTLEIEKLINHNDSIIFTRDFHPKGHMSIANNDTIMNYSTTWPKHCVNKNSECPRTQYKNHANANGNANKANENSSTKNKANAKAIANENLSTKNNGNAKANAKKSISNRHMTIKELLSLNNLESINFFKKFNLKQSILDTKIIGTNLSFTLYFTNYCDIIEEISESSYKIGITQKNKNIKPSYKNIRVPRTDPYNLNNINPKKFIELVKGQLCSYESYSAFNYHLQILQDNNKVNRNGVIKKNFSSKYITDEYDKNKKLKDLSTGLFEYILTSDKKNIVFIETSFVKLTDLYFQKYLLQLL